MTPTVNLLPPGYGERFRERRWAAMVGVGLLALLAVLGVVSLLEARQLHHAENRRDVERAHHTELQARRRQLAPFRELAAGVVGRERMLSAAMRTEVSWARLLGGLSQSFPAGASLTSLTVESILPPFGQLPPTELPTEHTVIGTTAFAGYSVREFAPGVQGTLEALIAVPGLSEPRLQEGALEEIGEIPVTTFDGTTFVDGAALSGRYVDGLPPEDDIEVPAIGGDGQAALAPGEARGGRSR